MANQDPVAVTVAENKALRYGFNALLSILILAATAATGWCVGEIKDLQAAMVQNTIDITAINANKVTQMNLLEAERASAQAVAALLREQAALMVQLEKKADRETVMAPDDVLRRLASIEVRLQTLDDRTAALREAVASK